MNFGSFSEFPRIVAILVYPACYKSKSHGQLMFISNTVPLVLQRHDIEINIFLLTNGVIVAVSFNVNYYPCYM